MYGLRNEPEPIALRGVLAAIEFKASAMPRKFHKAWPLSITRKDLNMRLALLLLLSFALVSSGIVLAHDPSHTSKRAAAIAGDEHPFGHEGDPKKVSRTIVIDMSDAMRYSPAAVQVKRGETIRFQIANSGKTMHELVLGTMSTLKDHAELMRKHPGMEHDEPHMAHVQPGRKHTLVWQFTKPGEFYYACLVPGHFEAGMVGKIVVTTGK